MVIGPGVPGEQPAEENQQRPGQVFFNGVLHVALSFRAETALQRLQPHSVKCYGFDRPALVRWPLAGRMVPVRGGRVGCQATLS